MQISVFRLWDKASGFATGGMVLTSWVLTVLDTYNSDRLQLALQSSNGTILSGGTGLRLTKTVLVLDG